GSIDIYLLDQVLRGNVADDAVVLDAGCGAGRNLEYFIRQGHQVYGVDTKPLAIERVREWAGRLGSGLDDMDSRFRVEPVEALSFPEGRFDLVICNAVLHFARDVDHFVAMTEALARVAKPGGTVFTRLASSIGIERFLDPARAVPGWHRLPDGSDRFIVDLEFLLARTEALGATLVDAIKTVNVQNRRCMTNWVWRR
ncbi:MAG: class I SAM-dependent methyltransferase, partial [Planctomycetes bacterium]|nr:class I SAM-dependent methyltransferase [Planctomycetota bacterium]